MPFNLVNTDIYNHPGGDEEQTCGCVMEAETENLGTPTFIDTKLFCGLQALMQPEDLTVLLQQSNLLLFL